MYNSNNNTSHPYTKLLTDFMSRNSLLNTYDLDPNFDCNSAFSRCDVKTNSYTLIDGILISESISNLVSNVRISDYGDNVSHHRAVEMDFSVSLSTVEVR